LAVSGNAEKPPRWPKRKNGSPLSPPEQSYTTGKIFKQDPFLNGGFKKEFAISIGRKKVKSEVSQEKRDQTSRIKPNGGCTPAA